MLRFRGVQIFAFRRFYSPRLLAKKSLNVEMLNEQEMALQENDTSDSLRVAELYDTETSTETATPSSSQIRLPRWMQRMNQPLHEISEETKLPLFKEKQFTEPVNVEKLLQYIEQIRSHSNFNVTVHVEDMKQFSTLCETCILLKCETEQDCLLLAEFLQSAARQHIPLSHVTIEGLGASHRTRMKQQRRLQRRNQTVAVEESEADWLILDLDSIVVHVQTSNAFERYNLPGLWKMRRSSSDDEDIPLGSGGSLDDLDDNVGDEFDDVDSEDDVADSDSDDESPSGGRFLDR